MRLIDVEDLIEVFKEKSTEAVLGADLCKAIIDRIESKPTVEIVSDFYRLKMCLKCPLDPDECGRTNEILKNGNCIKVDREEE